MSRQIVPVYVSTWETPLGPVLAAVDADGKLFHLTFTKEKAEIVLAPLLRAGETIVPNSEALVCVKAQLCEYFAGARHDFDLPLAPRGTAYQQAVWEQLRGIPAGSTLTYGQLAARMGNPNASRAVGGANGANRIAVVIPCHRVVGAKGSLTGFAFGLERKKALLALERG